MSWIAFFLCFCAWFGVAPLMPVIRQELALTKEQVGWCIVGSVGMTILARLIVGWLCDRIGPRLTYTWLLVIGSIPVMSIGLADDYSSLLFFRVLIGAIGASFVITQYHTSRMFASNCVGAANAMTAGWGNLGGGVTQMATPLLLTFLVGALGVSTAAGWRLTMFIVGVVCALTGIAYYFLTQDTPEGNYRQLRTTGRLPSKKSVKGSFFVAARDRRVWTLALIYGCCFGLELTIDNVAVLYFVDYFPEFRGDDPLQAMQTAGVIAGLFGGMNLFARALGGVVADRCGAKWGLAGRFRWLFLALFCEGLTLMLFAEMRSLAFAIPALLLFGLFVKMSNGAVYAVVPFVNREALGSVTGIVGAGGNVGAVAAGLLFKTEGVPWTTALLLLGIVVTCCSFAALTLTCSESEARAAAPIKPPGAGLSDAANWSVAGS